MPLVPKDHFVGFLVSQEDAGGAGAGVVGAGVTSCLLVQQLEPVLTSVQLASSPVVQSYSLCTQHSLPVQLPEHVELSILSPLKHFQAPSK